MATARDPPVFDHQGQSTLRLEVADAGGGALGASPTVLRWTYAGGTEEPGYGAGCGRFEKNGTDDRLLTQ